MPWVIGQLECGCRRTLGWREELVTQTDGKKKWQYFGEATQEFACCIGRPMLPASRSNGQPSPNMQRLLWVATSWNHLRHVRCSELTPEQAERLLRHPEVRIPIEEIENPSCALKDSETGTAEAEHEAVAFAPTKEGQLAWQL